MGILSKAAHAVGYYRAPKASHHPTQKIGGNRGRAVKHAHAHPQIPQNKVRVPQHGKTLANRNVFVIKNQQSYLPRPPTVHVQQHFHSLAGQYKYSLNTQVPLNSSYSGHGLSVTHTTASNYPLPQLAFNHAAVPVRSRAVYHLSPGQALYIQITPQPQAPAYAQQGGWGVSPKGGLHPPYPQQQRAKFPYYPQPQFHPGEYQQHKNELLSGHAPMQEAPPPYSPRQEPSNAQEKPKPIPAAYAAPLKKGAKPIRSTPHSIPVPSKSPEALKTPEPQTSPVASEKPAGSPRHPDISEKEVSIAKGKLGLPEDNDVTSEEVKGATETLQTEVKETRRLLNQEQFAVSAVPQQSVLADKILREGGAHEADIDNLKVETKYKLANMLLDEKVSTIKLAQTVLENTLEQPGIVSIDAGEITGLTNDRPQIRKAMSQFALSPKEPIPLEKLQESYDEDLQELAKHQEKISFGDDIDIEDVLMELELFPEEIMEEMSLKDMQATAQKFIDKKRQDIENYYQLLKPLAVE